MLGLSGCTQDKTVGDSSHPYDPFLYSDQQTCTVRFNGLYWTATDMKKKHKSCSV